MNRKDNARERETRIQFIFFGRKGHGHVGLISLQSFSTLLSCLIFWSTFKAWPSVSCLNDPNLGLMRLNGTWGLANERRAVAVQQESEQRMDEGRPCDSCL